MENKIKLIDLLIIAEKEECTYFTGKQQLDGSHKVVKIDKDEFFKTLLNGK